MKRQVLFTRTLLALATVAMAMGCEREQAPVDTEDPESLESLLADGELDLPKRAALTVGDGDSPTVPTTPPVPPMTSPPPPPPPPAGGPDGGVKPVDPPPPIRDAGFGSEG